MRTIARIVLVLSLAAAFTPPVSAQSPLQPSAKQLSAIVKSVLDDSRCPSKITFVSAGPAELDKKVDAKNLVGKTSLVLRDPVARRVYEVTALNNTGKVIEWKRVDDVESVLTSNDMDSTIKIVTTNKQWLASLERRNINPKDVFLDAWPSGIPRHGFGFRNVRVLTFVKPSGEHPKYSQPIEGLVCTVNLDARRLFEFYDRDVAPQRELEADPSQLYKFTKRNRLAPLTINQHASSAVSISNGVVSWNGWNFIPLMHSRDGLVLHNVTHTQGNTTRPVAARLSVAEIITTTSSTSQYWHFRQPLFVGEYGLGSNVVDQRVGIELPQNIRTLSSASINSSGKPSTINSAIALYEVDSEPVWLYTSDATVGRRGRSIVVQSHSVVAQRDVIQQFILSIDGSITIDVGIGGSPMIESSDEVSYSSDSDGPQSSTVLVSKQALVPYQSIACSFRLDLDVDGTMNTVEEVDLMRPFNSNDPYMQRVIRDVYPFYSEREAQRDVDDKVHRHWRVASTKTNGLGGTTAYRIMGAPLTTIVSDRHSSRTRAPFTKHSLWVTRFNENELYAAGKYPNQQVITSGVNTYQNNNEKIRNKDVVVWLTQESTFLPRVEDWPVSGLQHVSVRIEPDGFFDRNPATDVPPTK